MRERRAAARVGGAQLLRTGPDSRRHAASRRGRGGESGDGALSGGEEAPGGGGEQGPRTARHEAPAALKEAPRGAFSASDVIYGSVVDFLSGAEAEALTHNELETRLAACGRELLRQLFQDHLDLRASRERRVDVVIDAQGVAHHAIETDHRRGLATIVGEVSVTRLAYRAKGAENLHLQDASLNLPAERHSHGLRELAAIEATRGSYEEAQAAITRSTGVEIGKRQVEDLARRAAVDVESFYDEKRRTSFSETDVLVISADGKGIVMRPDALRPATRKAARADKHKLKTRLSKGEQRNSKRMAELAVVYDAAPVPRTPSDVLARSDEGGKQPAPVATGKWLTASVVDSAKEVIAEAFEEAERRDPGHLRPWVCLVDGAKHQIDVIRAEARHRGAEVTVVCDFIHVLEYLWGAVWCFFAEGDPAAEDWVAEKGLAVLSGKAGLVAGAIARKATALRLDKPRRKKADECARYLKNKRPYLDYPKALAEGWPIATGVIEGACRHLVRDRFDITGARWSLEGAEAMLKLRAVRANGDWAEYWHHHLAAEHSRVHASRYVGAIVPAAA
ncbi:MAG: ISKra4 family transposase [Actinomycetota bacterium]|nr:ISKra4 family transposase [Actinomycetota bacterium]